MSNHVVAEVIEAELVIGSVGNVAEVSLAALVVGESVEDTADCESEPAEHLAHFLSLSLCEVVIDGNNVNALACESVEVRGNARNESFTFTGLHLGDTSLMKNDSTNYLDGVGLLLENTPSRLSYGSKSLGENVVESLACLEPVLEFLSFSFELSVGELLILLVELENFILNWLNALELPVGVSVSAENAFKKTHLNDYRLYNNL